MATEIENTINGIDNYLTKQGWDTLNLSMGGGSWQRRMFDGFLTILTVSTWPDEYEQLYGIPKDDPDGKESHDSAVIRRGNGVKDDSVSYGPSPKAIREWDSILTDSDALPPSRID